MVVWGEGFTNSLLQFCIPALLSPRNIPALRNQGNRFLIATTDEDRKRIEACPIYSVLKQYVEPVFLRIPLPSDPAAFHLHMGIGHKLVTQMAFENGAYAVLLTPDLILSDGTIALVQDRALEGAQLVFSAALRFGEEPLFEHLGELGIASRSSRLGDEGRALVATGRQLVHAGIRSFHSETLTYEWDAPYFSTLPQACWWRVPGEDGVIVHSLSWAPILVDYGAVSEHDTSVMDRWTIDGDYIHRNLGLGARMHVVQDSDEAFLVSWAPLQDRAVSLARNSRFTGLFTGQLLKGLSLHEALGHPTFDPLKRRLFAKPVYWHADEIRGERWSAIERKAAGILQRYGGTLIGDAAQRGEARSLASLTVNVARIIRAFYVVPELSRHYWNHRKRVIGIAREALAGDQGARERVRRSLRNLAARIWG